MQVWTNLCYRECFCKTSCWQELHFEFSRQNLNRNMQSPSMWWWLITQPRPIWKKAPPGLQRPSHTDSPIPWVLYWPHPSVPHLGPDPRYPWGLIHPVTTRLLHNDSVWTERPFFARKQKKLLWFLNEKCKIIRSDFTRLNVTFFTINQRHLKDYFIKIAILNCYLRFVLHASTRQYMSLTHSKLILKKKNLQNSAPR